MVNCERATCGDTVGLGSLLLILLLLLIPALWTRMSQRQISLSKAKVITINVLFLFFFTFAKRILLTSSATVHLIQTQGDTKPFVNNENGKRRRSKMRRQRVRWELF